MMKISNYKEKFGYLYIYIYERAHVSKEAGLSEIKAYI
jgi:hypothetical protein